MEKTENKEKSDSKKDIKSQKQMKKLIMAIGLNQSIINLLKLYIFIIVIGWKHNLIWKIELIIK